MVLPPSKGYYVTERIDTPYLTPPPPPPSSHFTPSLFHSANDQISNQIYNTTKVDQKLSRLGLASSPEKKPSSIEQNEKLSLNSQEVNSVSQGRISQYPGYSQYVGPPPHASQGYKEWEAHSPPGVSKIVNRPPSPYKDKYKPNYVSVYTYCFLYNSLEIDLLRYIVKLLTNTFMMNNK